VEAGEDNEKTRRDGGAKPLILWVRQQDMNRRLFWLLDSQTSQELLLQLRQRQRYGDQSSKEH